MFQEVAGVSVSKLVIMSQRKMIPVLEPGSRKWGVFVRFSVGLVLIARVLVL